MSADRKKSPYPVQGGSKDAFSDHLDFGPEPEVTDYPIAGGTERIKRILKALQEINERMDRLASKL